MTYFRSGAARPVVAGALALGVLASGCVPKNKYDKVVAEKTAFEHTKKDDDAEMARLRDALEKAEAASQERDAQIAELSTSKHNVQTQLDEATAINQQLRGELERLGKNVDQILKEKGTLAKSLDDAKVRLEELRKAQAAAEGRAQLFRDLVKRFQRLVDSKQIMVATRRGQLVVVIPGDTLFDAGRAEVKGSASGLLMEIAKVLQSTPGLARSGQPAGRRYDVVVHTDIAPPPKGGKFRTNWDLSTARAAEVVRALTSVSVPPQALTAAGAAEYDPVASGDSADARAKNRRVELVLQASAEDMVAVPEVK